ncbi:mitochondrial carrier domain-containing protein [Scleroderma yunnanense]
MGSPERLQQPVFTSRESMGDSRDMFRYSEGKKYANHIFCGDRTPVWPMNACMQLGNPLYYGMITKANLHIMEVQSAAVICIPKPGTFVEDRGIATIDRLQMLVVAWDQNALEWIMNLRSGEGEHFSPSLIRFGPGFGVNGERQHEKPTQRLIVPDEQRCKTQHPNKGCPEYEEQESGRRVKHKDETKNVTLQHGVNKEACHEENVHFTALGRSLVSRRCALACGITHAAYTPIDAVKTNVQASFVLPLYPFLYIANGYQEGTTSIWKGFGPTLVGYTTQGAFKYSLYKIFKDLYINVGGEDMSNLKYKPAIWLMGSASAEFFADIISYTVAKIFFEGIVQQSYTYISTVSKGSCSKPTQLGITFTSGNLEGIICAVVLHPADTITFLVGKMDNKGKCIGTIVQETGLLTLATKGLAAHIIMIGTLTGKCSSTPLRRCPMVRQFQDVDPSNHLVDDVITISTRLSMAQMVTRVKMVGVMEVTMTENYNAEKLYRTVNYSLGCLVRKYG